MTSVIYNQTGRIRNRDYANIPATATAVYTATKAENPTVLKILVSNKDAGIKKVTVAVYRAATSTTIVQVKDYPIPIADHYLCNFEIQMLDGDEIRMTAETANTLDAMLLVSEGIGRGG